MTLIEVMLALAILVVLAVGVTEFFFQVITRRDRLVEIAGQQRDGAMLFGRLESAIMNAVSVGPDGAAGVSGGETSLSVITRGVSPMLAGNAAVGDTSRVSFEFVERSRSCTLGVAPGWDPAASVAEPVLGRVERVQFRYSDGRRWSGTFDSASAGGLPVAIELSIWFDSGPIERPAGTPGQGSEQDDTGFERFGPLDLPELGPADEAAEDAWIPREPDLMRVFGVPDAPEWQGRTS